MGVLPCGRILTDAVPRMNEPQGYLVVMSLGAIVGLLFVIAARLNTIIELLEGLT